MALKESYRTVARRQLIERLKSLLDWLEKDNPDVLVPQSLALIMDAAMRAYGVNFFYHFMEIVERHIRRVKGFCPTCDKDPNPLEPEQNICDECVAEDKEFMRSLNIPE